MPKQKLKNIILGIGNKVLSDDAAGLRVVRHIQKNYPNLDEVLVVDGSNIRYELTAVLESADNFIVVDATKLDQPPGTITTFLGSDMDTVLKSPGRNANEMALAEMMKIASLARQLPVNRALIAVEPKKITWGNRLSASVNKTIPIIAEQAIRLMNQWTGLSINDSHAPTTQPSPLSTEKSTEKSGEKSADNNSKA
jgi:hydrogenase maturation protease